MVLMAIALAASVAATNADVKAEASAKTNRVAKITAASTYYDSKEGVAFFSGRVFVDDEEYQLHADKAYVFMDKAGTNALKRIVAIGGVAMTNDTKRAYGVKASYYRDSGMIVLYGDETQPAEVRDEKEDPPQVVTGSKIKFWTGSEQVLVEGATISAPVGGKGGIDSLKKSIGGK